MYKVEKTQHVMSLKESKQLPPYHWKIAEEEELDTDSFQLRIDHNCRRWEGTPAANKGWGTSNRCEEEVSTRDSKQGVEDTVQEVYKAVGIGNSAGGTRATKDNKVVGLGKRWSRMSGDKSTIQSESAAPDKPHSSEAAEDTTTRSTEGHTGMGQGYHTPDLGLSYAVGTQFLWDSSVRCHSTRHSQKGKSICCSTWPWCCRKTLCPS